MTTSDTPKGLPAQEILRKSEVLLNEHYRFLD